MSDPTLKKSTVAISYTSSDRFRWEWKHKTGAGYPHLVTGADTSPEKALLNGLEELARLTALFGFEAEALERFNNAQARVAAWKKSRA